MLFLFSIICRRRPLSNGWISKEQTHDSKEKDSEIFTIYKIGHYLKIV